MKKINWNLVFIIFVCAIVINLLFKILRGLFRKKASLQEHSVLQPPQKKEPEIEAKKEITQEEVEEKVESILQEHEQ